MGVIAKRSSMTFYSDTTDQYSHRVRIVLAEKGVAVEIQEVDKFNQPIELADLNPYNSLPTLVDRDLVLYEAGVMMEYLDERFPHPPLLPVYPVARAQSRLWMHRVEKDWATLVNNIVHNCNDPDQSRKTLEESLISIAPIFSEKDFFMSDTFTIVDCCIAPIMWRLPILGIDLDEKKVKPLIRYMNSLFDRDSFQQSLSGAEQDMRP